MKLEDRNKLIREFIEEHCFKVMETKGVEYSGDSDANANFKRLAKQLGLNKFQIWSVYAGKHWDSILSWIREGKVLSDESIEGRIGDIVNYLFILYSMIMEDVADSFQETHNQPRLVGVEKREYIKQKHASLRTKQDTDDLLKEINRTSKDQSSDEPGTCFNCKKPKPPYEKPSISVNAVIGESKIGYAEESSKRQLFKLFISDILKGLERQGIRFKFHSPFMHVEESGKQREPTKEELVKLIYQLMK